MLGPAGMSNHALALSFVAALAAVTPAHADSKPTGQVKTIVLVHGAWADGASWDKVIPILEAKGYRVVATHDPLSSLADDVATVKRVIDAQPGPVILVGHSWGGAVITAAGTNDKVVGLVYVAAFAPDDGESINAMLKTGKQPGWASKLQLDSAGFASLPDDVVAQDFAQDLTRDEQRIVTATQGPFAMRSFDDRMNAPAWKNKPAWYVRAENDHMIDPAMQMQMAKRMKATVTSIPSSHVAMLAKPKEVAAVILTAAAASPKVASAR